MLCCAHHTVQRLLSRGSLAAAALWLSGCASPGNPRPPSLHLPEPVSTLVAERVDGTVALRFAVPAKTTDGLLIHAPVKAELCRAVGPGPCRATESFPATRTVAGQVEWVDVLPPDLNQGTERKLTYKVQLLNSADRGAGWSEPAFAASGPAPAAVEGLRAEGYRGGIVLRWTPSANGNGDVLVERKNLQTAQRLAKEKEGTAGKKAVTTALPNVAVSSKATSAKEKDTVWLHANDGAGAKDAGGTVDGSAMMDTPYRYTALRSRTVTLDGTALELRSSISSSVDYSLHDVYPPSVPQGLAAAEFSEEGSPAVSVDLIWQPDSERDLAGYSVYRQPVSATGSVSGPPDKLNAKLLVLPSFRDSAAAHAQHYRYTVTATDTGGNTSAASTPVDVQTAP